ncbi:MAG: hypothetical protein WA948_03805 [Pontixanthobacter sp.]
MYTFLFRNRYGALAFVGLTLIGAASLVGTQEDEGLITQTAATIEQQRADFEDAAKAAEASRTPATQPEPEPSIGDYAPAIPIADDEDLIDDAEGIDPTPIDPSDGEAIAKDGDVVIILRDGQNRPQFDERRHDENRPQQ